MTTEALEDLQALGFTEYEARAYLGLLEKGPLTGYQLAKACGVPRPNIYAVLDRLQERGAVTTVQVKEGVKYAALPSKEMLDRLARTLGGRIEKAGRDLGKLQEAPAVERVWNLQGHENVIERARSLIGGTERSLLACVWSDESRELAEAFAAAAGKGAEVTTLCIEGCPEECGGCCGAVYRYPLAGEAHTRWLVLVADDRELLVAQVFPDGRALGAVTTLEVLVSVGARYLQHSIAATEIVRSLGPRLGELLDERAQKAMRSAGLSAHGSAWLDRILAATREVEARQS